MWLYAAGSFAIALFNLTLWTLTFTKRHLSPLAKAYFWWSFYITLWSFGYGITLGGFLNYEATLWINKWCQAMATMIGPFFFRFGCCVAGEFEKYKRTYQIYLWFGILNATALFFTPYYVRGLWSFGVFRYQPLGGPLYIIFTAFFFWCTIHSFIVAAKKYRSSIGRKQKQIKLFLLGTGIAYSGGGELFLQGYGIPIASYGVFPILAYVIVIGYAIHKYQFLDLPNLVRRTVVFAGLFGFVVGTVSLVVYLANTYLSTFVGINQTIATAIAIVIAILLYDPVKIAITHLTNRYLFQKKYDIREIITQLASRSVEILDIDSLSKEIVETLVSAMNLHSASVAILDEKEQSFQVIHSYGIRELKENIPEEDRLVHCLGRTKEILNLEDPESRKLPMLLLSRMESLNAVIGVPLFIREQLVGFITLGKKKSDAEYTKDDFDYFTLFQSQFAVALSNARLYYLLKRSQLEFAQQAKMAAIGILSQGINHQVRNPLTIIKGKAQVLRMNLRDGMYNGKSREDLVRIIDELTSVAIESADRASDIMVRLSSFARPTTGNFDEEVDLKKPLDEILPFIEKQLELSNIQLEIRFPHDLPHVLGDGKQIGEVFLNLLNNAYQAILQKDKEARRLRGEMIGTIQVSAEEKDGGVFVHFEDTGVGIPADKLEEIYTPFYTTKEDARTKDPNAVTGTGLGLYVCRQIMEQHQGKIQVKSKLGEGTAFTLVFTRLAQSAQRDGSSPGKIAPSP